MVLNTQRPQEGISRDELLLQLDTLEQIAARYELCDHIERIKDRKHDTQLPLVILVAGEGNFGKSSLINHLAGREIAPVSILPLTWKVDVYLESDTGDDYAIVRESGQEAGRVVSIHEARELCAREEHSLKDGSKSRPSIIEVIWRMTSLQLGPDLCLVDTPGLSAAGLGVDIVVERLVKGLGGSKFILEDVWARYYHRADVVLWAFEATKMESAATFETLRKLCLLQKKEIIPVVTKADRVPKERWKEVRVRFNDLYHDQFGKAFHQDDIHFTICGGKSADIGFGVHQLRTILQQRYAPVAIIKKNDATKLFVIDLSREIKHILDVCARQLNANLRVIADTADEVALLLMRQRIDSENEFRRHSQQWISKLHNELTTKIKPLFLALLNNTDTEYSFREKVISQGISIQSIEDDLRGRLRMLGATVHSRAIVLSTTRRLQRARIGSSGNETNEVFSFELAVDEPDVAPIRIDLHSISIPPASSLKEWAKETWTKFKRFFGSEELTDNEKKALSQYCNEIIKQLTQKLEEERSVFCKYQKHSLAPALRTAVEQSLENVHSCNMQSLINALEEVDGDVRVLNGMQHKDAAASLYADWARYWISESRDVALVRKLAANIIEPNIGKLRQYVIEFLPPTIPDATKRCSWALWRRGKRSVGAASATQDSSLLLSCYQAEVSTSAILVDYDQRRSKDGQKTIRYMIDRFKVWVGKDRVFSTFEKELGEALPGASAQQSIQSYVEILSGVYMARMSSMLLGTTIRPSVAVSKFQAITVSSFWKKAFTLILTLSICALLLSGMDRNIPAVHHYITLVGGISHLYKFAVQNHYSFIAVLSAALISTICLLLTRITDTRLNKAMHIAFDHDYHDAIVAVNTMTASKIDHHLIDDLTSQMVIQLNPRPLQRALAGGDV